MRARVGLGALVVCLLVFPYIALVSQVHHWTFPFDEVAGVLAFTFEQAFLSAAAALVVGGLSAYGLSWMAERVSPRWMRVQEFFVLLPNATPVLFLLLATLKLLPGARGFVGIVFVHVCLNAGLVAVSLQTVFRSKLAGMSELAWIEGASRWQFFRRGVLPTLRDEILTLGLFVFALCFASFAVPLVLGGSRATTMETLIYQKIRIDGNWGEAVGLASLQTLSIFVLSWILRSRAVLTPNLSGRTYRLPLMSWSWGLVFSFLPSLFLLSGLVEGLPAGFAQLLSLVELRADIGDLLAGSMLVALGTGGLCIAFLAALAFVNPRGLLRRLLLGYATPSAVLTGFALLFLWRTTGTATYVKIIFGLSIATVPSFYRLQWDSLLRALEGQRVVALTMGASEWLTFSRVVWPALVRPAFQIGGLAAVWAWGDFGLSSVVAERSLTVAMVVQGLMGSYRLDAATALVWIVIAGAGFTYLLFAGAARVLGSQSEM